MDGRRNFSFYFGGEPVDVKDPGIADLRLTAKDRMHKRINEALDLPELEKTKLEKKILGDIFFAIKQACSKLGLKDFIDAISFDMQNIHIISEEAYSTNLPPDSGGSNIWGEVYLIRSENGNNLHFVSSATHELAHYVSYREADIQQGVNSEQVLLRPKGVGYSNSPEGHAEQYVGLMEGVNEIFAHNVRQEFVKVNKNLSAKEKKLLINTRDAYSYLEYLILDLVYKLAKDESEYFELLDNLLRGHITGSHDFLKIAEDRMPGAIDILGGLGTSPQDTLVAAKKFGLTDAVQYVSDYIATKERELEKENLK